MKNLPNLDLFLSAIDPKITIDRKRASAELTTVVILESIKDLSKQLSEDQRKGLADILKNEKLEFDEIMQFMTANGKKDEFLNLLNKNSAKVVEGYIKNHLDKMELQKREEIYSKFPVLREL